MRYYPINLDVKNRECLVVGGGNVGLRKVITLLECGAKVTVVSPEVEGKIENLAKTGEIRLKKRDYIPSDMEGVFLAIGATDDEELNREISRNAEALNTLCNIADRPESCNFILPAIVKRGDLVIAVSTSGKSPAFAKKLRKKLEKEFGPEYSDFLELMGAVRKKLLSRAHEPEAHKELFEQLIDRGLVSMIKEKNIKKIDETLLDVLGKGFVYASLMNPEGS